MPSRTYSVVAGSTALVAATAKTAIELATGATITNNIVQYSVSFNGAPGTAVPVTVEWITYTTTGTGTAYTPNKISSPPGPASVTTAKVNMTAEGTGSITVIDSQFVPPTSGVAYQFPLGREIAMGASAFLGLRLTAPVAVNYLVTIYFEE